VEFDEVFEFAGVGATWQLAVNPNNNSREIMICVFIVFGLDSKCNCLIQINAFISF